MCVCVSSVRYIHTSVLNNFCTTNYFDLGSGVGMTFGIQKNVKIFADDRNSWHQEKKNWLHTINENCYCFWVSPNSSCIRSIPLLCFKIELHYFLKEYTHTFFFFLLDCRHLNLWRKFVPHFPLTFSIIKIESIAYRRFSEQNSGHSQVWRPITYSLAWELAI